MPAATGCFLGSNCAGRDVLTWCWRSATALSSRGQLLLVAERQDHDLIAAPCRAGTMLQQIDHINLVVDDLEAMTAFYCEVLGLRVTKEATISGGWVESVVGLEGVQADVVYLEFPEGPRVELIRYLSPQGERPDCLGAPNTKGLRHVAFRVADIEEVADRLQQASVRLFSEIQKVPDSQVTYAGGVRKRLVYFRDPEGNLLELCEYSQS